MHILVDNLALAEQTTVNGENDSFPVENMYNNTLIEKTYFDDYITIDMGVATAIDSVGITTEDNLILQANTSDSWTTPAFELPLDEIVQYISETYRYWRIAYSDGTFEPIAYNTGTDALLESPNDDYDTSSNFIPIEDSGGSGGVYFKIGDYTWTGDLSGGGAVGDDITFTGDSLGTAYGSVMIDSFNGANWNSVASGANDGFKEFKLPKSANSDDLGGSIYYYFKSAAWSTAFVGVGTVVIIAQNGSVYIDTITQSNLVVRWDGTTGLAGGGGNIADTTRYGVVSGTAKVNYFYLGNKLEIECQEIGSTPQPNTTDIVNRSTMGVENITPGIFYITQPFRFPLATGTEWALFDDWFQTSDRNNSHYIVPFPDDTDNGVFYGNIAEYSINARDKLVYDFGFTGIEVK